MITKIKSELRRDEGFSLIELLIVVAIIGIIAAIAIPQLMNAMDRARQRRSMGDMRNIGTSNGTFRVDTGAYAAALTDLEPDYMQVVPVNDGWGNAWETYTGGADTYTLQSDGSDPADPVPPGTPPGADWINEPFEADIIMIDGQFTQAPGSQ